MNDDDGGRKVRSLRSSRASSYSATPTDLRHARGDTHEQATPQPGRADTLRVTPSARNPRVNARDDRSHRDSSRDQRPATTTAPSRPRDSRDDAFRPVNSHDLNADTLLPSASGR